MLAVQPLVKGLSVEGMNSPTPLVTNFICNVKWKELQTVPFGPLLHPNPIDAALQSGKTFRVRLYFGRHSPDFAYSMAGSVELSDAQDKVVSTVPKWWSDNLLLAQDNLIARLAQVYDGAISSIFIASNMTIYAEPFMRHTAEPINRSNLVAAGYDEWLDQVTYDACQFMFSSFQSTRLAWAFNPWQYVTASGDNGNSTDGLAFTLDQMHKFVTKFPSGIIQNNSIRYPIIKGAYTTMYAAMKVANAPLSFQTATMARVGNLPSTLQWAVDQGAHLVEVAPGFEKLLTNKQITDFDNALRANA